MARAARWTRLAGERALVGREFATAARRLAQQAESEAGSAAAAVAMRQAANAAAAEAALVGAGGAGGMPSLMMQLDDAVAMALDEEDEGVGDVGGGDVDEEDMMDDL